MTKYAYRNLIIIRAQNVSRQISLEQRLKENRDKLKFLRSGDTFEVDLFDISMGKIKMPPNFIQFLTKIGEQSRQEVKSPDQAYEYLFEGLLGISQGQQRQEEIFNKNMITALWGQENHKEWVDQIKYDVVVNTFVRGDSGLAQQYKNMLNAMKRKQQEEKKGIIPGIKRMFGLSAVRERRIIRASQLNKIKSHRERD